MEFLSYLSGATRGAFVSGGVFRFEALAISPGLLLAFNCDVGYKSLAYVFFRI